MLSAEVESGARTHCEMLVQEGSRDCSLVGVNSLSVNLSWPSRSRHLEDGTEAGLVKCCLVRREEVE